jgi:hypothetical protein
MVCRKLSSEQSKRWRRLVGQALRHLEDRIWLADSRLARLECAEALAKQEFVKRFLPEGLAVQKILQDACNAARAEFADSPFAVVLETVLAGDTVTAFADRLLLNRTSAHRTYWRPVLDFIIEYVLDVEAGLRDAA